MIHSIESLGLLSYLEVCVAGNQCANCVEERLAVDERLSKRAKRDVEGKRPKISGRTGLHNKTLLPRPFLPKEQ